MIVKIWIGNGEIRIFGSAEQEEAWLKVNAGHHYTEASYDLSKGALVLSAGVKVNIPPTCVIEGSGAMTSFPTP